MGNVCMQAREKAVKGLAARQNAKQAAKDGPPPEVGRIIYIPDYQELGTVTAVNGSKCTLQSFGPVKDTGDYSYKGWEQAIHIEELAPFFPNGEGDGKVTAHFRDTSVNGYIKGFDDQKKIIVQFLPDEAHDKVDKTHWALGDTVTLDAADIVIGHAGAERPRNRTAEEKAAEKKKVMGYGVAYMCCSSCGRGMWEDPCDCYPSQKRKGYHCQTCGKKAAGKNSRCCGTTAVGSQAQNQGWASVLMRQYGDLA